MPHQLLLCYPSAVHHGCILCLPWEETEGRSILPSRRHACGVAAQFAEAKQLQRESAARLNGFIDELRAGGKVDLSAKNLGEEGTAYIAEALAFNDR